MLNFERLPGALPAVNTRVDLWGSWHRWIPSRIEQSDANGLHLAAPEEALVVARVDDTLSVRWVTPRGLGTVDGVVGEIVDDPIPVWRIEATGAPEILQRRRFARTPVTVPLAIERVEDDVHLVVPGSTIDLSEGGTRCVLHGRDLANGAVLHVSLDLGGDQLRADGLLLRRQELRPGFTTLAVEFVDLPRRDADRLRRFVFTMELRSLSRSFR